MVRRVMSFAIGKRFCRWMAVLLTMNCVHAPDSERNRDRIRFEDDAEVLTEPYGEHRRGGGRGRPSQTFPFLPSLPPPTHRGPIAFSVVRTHPVSRSCPRGACNILFENVLTASEASYDRSSGVFHCPMPGLYFFSFSAISPSYASFRVALVKNDREVVSAYGSAKGFDSAGNVVLLPLVRGDKVCLRLLEGELYESPLSYRAYTSFCGFLLLQESSGEESHGPKSPDREPFDGATAKPEPGPRSLPNLGANETVIDFEE